MNEPIPFAGNVSYPTFEDITVVAIHGNGGIEREIPALRKNMAALPGCKGLIVTNKLIDTDIPQKLVHQTLDYESFQDFLVYALHNYVDTDYVLISQSDGWILNPGNWRDEWFNYDYIGGYTHAAYIPSEQHYYTNYGWIYKPDPLVVQNGGLSLRSRKLLEAPTKYGIMKVPMEQKVLRNEDIQLCCWMRPALEKVGIKFAPKEESMLFSFEHLDHELHKDFDLTKILGHHSRFRRLIGDNKMTIDIPQDWNDTFPLEDKVIELFEHYGYEIDYLDTNPKDKPVNKLVEEAPYNPGYEDAVPKKQAKLFIATPMYGGLCNGNYTVGLLQSVSVFSQAGVAMQFAYMMNESLITRARNSLAYDFLATDCTHLMFIDADIGFNPQDILPMIDADKDIICGLYPKKEINWPRIEKAVHDGYITQDLHKFVGAFVVNAVGDSVTGNVADCIEISNGGTGFMLIKREVFEGLSDKVPFYHNDMFLATDDMTKVKVIKEFFATSIEPDTKRLLSEDYHFCKIAREAGYKVYAAPWAELTHCGSYNFSGYLGRQS
jgi:hypothetical protein